MYAATAAARKRDAAIPKYVCRSTVDDMLITFRPFFQTKENFPTNDYTSNMLSLVCRIPHVGDDRSRFNTSLFAT